MCGGNLGSSFAHAETNFEKLRGRSSKRGNKITGRIRVSDAEPGQQDVDGAALCVRDTALAQHEAADMSLLRIHGSNITSRSCPRQRTDSVDATASPTKACSGRLAAAGNDTVGR